MPERIIEADRSVIIAADMKPDRFEYVIDETADVEGISAYKLGFVIGLSRIGLPLAVEKIKARTNKKVIYDHQKGGTDIPDTGPAYAEALAEAGVDAGILFPLTGPLVEEAWIKALQDKGIGVIVGGEMTHKQYKYTEGGRIADAGMLEMYEQAANLGVRDFVVPGNRLDRVKYYRGYFNDKLGEGEFTFYAPGFVAQGGEISEAGQAAGENWHAIVGRGIIAAADVHVAAVEHTQQILAGNGK